LRRHLSNTLSDLEKLAASIQSPDINRFEAMPTQRTRVQPRLTTTQVEELVARYEDGATIRVLAHDFAIHKHTVSAHLERQGIPRRVSVRKLAPADHAEAVRLYEHGLSLVSVAEQLKVNPSTVMRELQRAGVSTRARNGDATTSLETQTGLSQTTTGARSEDRGPRLR